MAHKSFAICDALTADGTPCGVQYELDRDEDIPLGWAQLVRPVPCAEATPRPSFIRSLLDQPAIQALMAEDENPKTKELLDAMRQIAAEEAARWSRDTDLVRSLVCDQHEIPAVVPR